MTCGRSSKKRKDGAQAPDPGQALHHPRLPASSTCYLLTPERTLITHSVSHTAGPNLNSRLPPTLSSVSWSPGQWWHQRPPKTETWTPLWLPMPFPLTPGLSSSPVHSRNISLQSAYFSHAAQAGVPHLAPCLTGLLGPFPSTSAAARFILLALSFHQIILLQTFQAAHPAFSAHPTSTIDEPHPRSPNSSVPASAQSNPEGASYL